MAPEAKGARSLAAFLYPLAFVVLTIVALLRRAGVEATNSIWAEDGALFYRDALSAPGPSNLVQTYNGYVQLLPRLVFEGIRYVSVADAAFAISVTGAALVAALGLLPAALATGVGTDSQRPFALVIVSGLFTRLLISIYLMPALYTMVARPADRLEV